MKKLSTREIIGEEETKDVWESEEVLWSKIVDFSNALKPNEKNNPPSAESKYYFSTVLHVDADFY